MSCLHDLNMVLMVPHYPAARWADDKIFIESDGFKFYCRNCGHPIKKIKKPEDFIRWRKCPTCGYVFIKKQYYSVDEFMEEVKIETMVNDMRGEK